MKSKCQFILIDDDPINNFICREIINMSFSEKMTVLDFTSAQDCLDYITSEYGKTAPDISSMLFVDINMPNMSGWEFLDQFALLSDDIKKMFRVYIVSSSINPLDKKKAEANPYVQDYITKPITEEFLHGITKTDKNSPAG